MPVTYSYDEIVDMIYNYLPPDSKRFELIRSVYGVPNGGVIPAALIATHLQVPLLSNLPLDTDETVDRNTILVVDDIIDSGATREKFKEFPFLALVVKNVELNIFQNGCQTPTHFIHHISSSQWIVFPWEHSEDGSPSSIEDNITRILQYVGEDVHREGLKETPKRVVKAYDELCAGYKIDPASVFKVFDSEKYDGIVILKNVEFHSLCEHHMLPFSGKAHIAYIPNEKVIGVSKLARLLEIYTRRLQIQERIGEQVVNDIMKYLSPKGAACILEAQHMCMTCRGVNKQDSVMITSSLRGCFLEKDSARQELMSLIK